MNATQKAAITSFLLGGFDPLNPIHQAEIIRFHEITDKELFKYIVLAYFNSSTDYTQIHFDTITVSQIMNELLLDPSKPSSGYKNHDDYFVQLGEPDPIDNRGITFNVLQTGIPPSLISAPTPRYSVAFFISIMEYYKKQIINDEIKFSWGKRLALDGKVYLTIVFKFRVGDEIMLFDYSSEDPTVFLMAQD